MALKEYLGPQHYVYRMPARMRLDCPSHIYGGVVAASVRRHQNLMRWGNQSHIQSPYNKLSELVRRRIIKPDTSSDTFHIYLFIFCECSASIRAFLKSGFEAKNLCTSYKTRRYITVFKRTHHRTLSRTECIQPISLRPTLRQYIYKLQSDYNVIFILNSFIPMWNLREIS